MLSSLLKIMRLAQKKARLAPQPPRARPRLEALEDRFAPANVGQFIVANSNASGPGSFDQAVSDLNNQGAASNQIVFQGVTGAIALPHNEEIARNVDILGPGSSNLTLRGDFTFRLMQVNAGVTASITGLHLSGGEAGALDGGAIANLGALTLSNDLLDYNHATNGGAIWNAGSLALWSTTLRDNTATGVGGAIRNDGQLSLSNCMVVDNYANAAAGIYNSSVATFSSSNSLITGNVLATGDGMDNASNADGTGSSVLTPVNAPDDTVANGGFDPNGNVSPNNSTLSSTSGSGQEPAGAFEAPDTWSQSSNNAVMAM